MFPTGRLAQGLARFLDMEEVTGSIPVSPTSDKYCGAGGSEGHTRGPFPVLRDLGVIWA
jgi:hypothetical protein